MERFLGVLVLVLLASFVTTAAKAETIEVIPGFQLTVAASQSVEAGAAANAQDLGDLFSQPKVLACGTCTDLKRECRLECAEMGCIMMNWRCYQANPCDYNCFCFCN